jgi:hypothetical protein
LSRFPAISRVPEACPDCGASYALVGRVHRCAPVSARHINSVNVNRSGPINTPSVVIGVRLRRDLLAKLDAIRGERTRPDALRALLEEHNGTTE